MSQPIADRPGPRVDPYVQEVFRTDTVRPPDVLLRHHVVDQGDADIDRSRFWSPAWHELEVERVWRRSWQVACREEDIPGVGDHIVYDIARDSMLVVRTGPSVFKAFFNSCLHRGTTLRLTGGTAMTRFVCPFHGWAWKIDGTLDVLPAEWDFPQVDRSKMSLPEAVVDTWGGFVFVNMDPAAPPLLEYLAPLPDEMSPYPLEERYKGVHVRKIVPCNWKIALEAFAEAYHVGTTHRQATPFSGDTNSQYDTWNDAPHVSRMITLTGIPSPNRAETTDEEIAKAMMPPGDLTPMPAHLTARQFLAERHRAHFERRFSADLSERSDADILDAVQYHVFPNFSPWAGIGQPITYLWRPNGDDPETSIMDVMYLWPLPASGERPPPAAVIELGIDEPWANAKALGKYAPIFEQDSANFARIQKGVRAGRKGNTYSIYQESKIRHFHRTLDAYIAGDMP